MNYTDAAVDKLLDALEAKQATQRVKLQPYTVLMTLPTHMLYNFGMSTYLAHVEAETVEEAQSLAQREALQHVTDDDESEEDPTDFYVCFVCEGHMADIHIW